MTPDERSPSPVLDRATASLPTRANGPRKTAGSRNERNRPPVPTDPNAASPHMVPNGRPSVGGYELVHALGRGGMGTVWLARQQHTGQRVALKLINACGDANYAEVERLLTEAKAGSRLQHPNIVRVLHFGTADGCPFFTMELLHGGSLRERLSRGPLQPHDAARLVRQAAEAIQYAHEHQVLHRDLTPANLMLTSPDWEVNEREPAVPPAADRGGVWAPPDATLGVKVCDFGLARLQDMTQHQTRSGDQIGTPLYMSPEQARGDLRELSARTDVYGLGAVLYACLTGRPPFQAATAAETLWQVWHRDPVPVRALVPGVSRELEAVCLKCLEKDPRRRYATAKELADDLGRWLEGKSVLARPAGPLRRASKWARRNAAVASWAAAVLLSLISGVAVSSYFAVSAGREASAAYQAKGEANEALTEARVQLDRAERAVYVGQLSQAWHEFREGNVARARQILAGCEPKFRHIEHHLLWTRFSPLREMKGHTAGVRGVAFHPDGRRVASAGQDKVIRVWDAETGAELQVLRGHQGSVWGVRYSPDGRRLVSCSPYEPAILWDAEAGRPLRRLRGHWSGALAVAFSADGKRVVSGGMDKSVRGWDAETGREVFTLKGHDRLVTCVAFSPDGKRVVSGSWDFTVRCWDLATRREVLSMPAHQGHVLSVGFSPDGQRICSAGEDGKVRLWNAYDGRRLFEIGGNVQGVNAVAFNPDGNRLVGSIGDGTVKVWDAATGAVTLTLKGHLLPVTGVAFSPDGKRIVSGGGNLYDPAKPGEVMVWDAERGQEVRSILAHGHSVNQLTFTPSGDRFLSAGQDGVCKVWDAATCRVLVEIPGHKPTMGCATFSPDGSRVATGGTDYAIRGWDASSGKLLFEIVGGHRSNITHVDYSRDGKHLLSCSRDKSVKVWDLATGKEWLTLRGHTEEVWCAKYSPDGRRIATVAGDPFKPARAGEVKLWDADTGEELLSLQGHRCPVFSLAFSPDGRRLYTGGFNGDIKAWDVASGTELFTMRGHAHPVKCVTCTPDGRRVLTAAADHTNPGKPGELKVWDAERGQELFSLLGHDRPVNCVAVHPDGKRIISGDWGRRIMVWDARKQASDN